MATYHATGITLLVHKYKGTSRLAVFFTRERGKVEATVSGVGKPGSKLAPAVEPLTLSKLFFAEGRSLDRLTQCDVIDTFYELRNDIQRLALASYAGELVARTTEPDDADPVLFDALRDTLTSLTASPQPQMILWGFVLKYLCLHGVGPEFASCPACGCSPEQDARYVAELGGCVCAGCHGQGMTGMPVPPQARSAMQAMLKMPVGRLERLRLAPGIQNVVREVLRMHIKYHMGVELKTEAFLAKMVRSTPAS